MAFLVGVFEGDFDAFKQQFDSDPLGRKQAAKGHTMLRGVDYPNEIFLRVAFDSAEEATSSGQGSRLGCIAERDGQSSAVRDRDGGPSHLLGRAWARQTLRRRCARANYARVTPGSRCEPRAFPDLAPLVLPRGRRSLGRGGQRLPDFRKGTIPAVGSVVGTGGRDAPAAVPKRHSSGCGEHFCLCRADVGERHRAGSRSRVSRSATASTMPPRPALARPSTSRSSAIVRASVSAGRCA